MSRSIKVAACQYLIQLTPGFEAYVRKIRALVEEAVSQQARLLLFPEYAGLELMGMLPNPEDLAALQAWLPQYQALFSELAREFQVYLVSGSLPVLVEQSKTPVYYNRAFIFFPSGEWAFQDKVMMTRFEGEGWVISSAKTLNVFETDFGKVGIAICYDSEFPTLVRRQVEAGAEVILVPSCTDTVAGYNRVRIACRARAMENQCYVVQSPLVGEVASLLMVDANLGRAGVFSPVDIGFPENGVLAEGEWNHPQWVFAELDLEKLQTVRADGQVLNHRDWAGTDKIDPQVQYVHAR